MTWLVVMTVWLSTAVSVGAAPGGLRFTEYLEGSGSDKALEICNDSGASVSLSGCQVRCYFNGSTSPGLTLQLSGNVAGGDVFVLAKSGADPAVLAVADQIAAGNWFNGDDAVALVKDGVILDVIGQIGVDPGSAWGQGDTSTADQDLRRSPAITTGDADGSDAFDPGLQWQGFPPDTLSGLGAWPDPVVLPVALSIPQIQGAGHSSPVDGSVVETTGVVTAVEAHGFYLQDPIGDGDASTSDGVFVFTSSAPAVWAGQRVAVTGTVHEFQPGGASSANLTTTELSSLQSVTVLSSGNLPAPVLLGSSGRLPPTAIVDDDDLLIFDPVHDGIDFFESLEGMAVQIRQPLAVAARNEFGELFTVTDGGRFATRINPRSGITLSARDGNPERIKVVLDPFLVPDFDPAVNTGDHPDDIVGVVSYDFGNYEVKATQPFAVSSGGLQPETAGEVPPGDQLSIAGFNVLNLDPKVESFALVGSAADVDDDVGTGRFDRLAEEIVGNLRAPDIIGLQEIQDDDGAEQTSVTDAGLTYATLIAAIANVGGPLYAFRDVPPASGSSGGQPGGNIRVGLLFDPARVSVDDASVEAIADPDLRDGDAFEASRRPLLARFEFRGRRVTVIVNHFASKSGGTSLFGAVQPPVNGSVDKRIAQAKVVHDRVSDILVADRAAHVVVLGDFNEFFFNEPLLVLQGQFAPVLVNLTGTLPDLERYSYVFEGNAQSLDHMFVSAALAPLATYDVVHVNAEFADQASDHDPHLARFAFPEVCQPDLGSGCPGGATLSVCGDPLAPSGTALLALSGLPAGAPGILFETLAAAPAGVHGGLPIPIPLPGNLALVGDARGAVAVPLTGAPVGVPLEVVVQFAYRDARGSPVSPGGLALSNAVKIQFPGAWRATE